MNEGFFFKPHELVAARERLAKTHTVARSQVEKDPHTALQLLQPIIERLRASQGRDDALRRLVANLRKLERSVFSTLLMLPDDPLVVEYAVQCAQIDPTLFTPDGLWRAHSSLFRKPAANLVGTLLLSDHSAYLNEPQAQLLRNLYGSPDADIRGALLRIWRSAEQRMELFPALLTTLKCPKGSALATDLEDALLTLASRKARELHSPAALK